MAALQTSFVAAEKVASSISLGASAQHLAKANVAVPALPRSRKAVSPVAATKVIKSVKVLEPFADKAGTMRGKVVGEAADVKLLTRVQQMRLLSKLEKAGLLSLLDSVGLSLSAIEQSGLLSTAESLGLLSTATDPATPGKLLTAALVLLAAGPAAAYFIPEDNWGLVALQIVIALTAAAGGAAAFGASKLISSLQKAA